MERPRNAYCSYCRKSYRDVGPLVEGPGDVYICKECTELCLAIIKQEVRRRNPSPPILDPAHLREKLDTLVPGQDEAKRALVVAATRRNDSRGNVLLVGSARSTKLLLTRALAHALDVPFASGDATGLVKSMNAPTALPILYALLHANEFDTEAAQRGIVYVDGLDDPQMQDTSLNVWQGIDPKPLGDIPFDVRGLLFVCGGTFPALANSHPQQPVTPDALVAAGARPGWVQQLAAIARVEPLDEDVLFRTMSLVEFAHTYVPPAEA